MIYLTPFTFFRGDVTLAGHCVAAPIDFDVRQRAIIVTGSWLTVKEQMPEVYATRLAERGPMTRAGVAPHVGRSSVTESADAYGWLGGSWDLDVRFRGCSFHQRRRRLSADAISA